MAGAAPVNARDLLKRCFGLPVPGYPVIAAFPKRQAIVKTVELPAAGAEELRLMAQQQAFRLIPLSREEMVVDSQPQGAPEEGKQRMLIVAARRDEVREFLLQLSRQGIVPDQVTLEGEATRVDLRPEDMKARARRTFLKAQAVVASTLLLFLVSLVALGGWLHFRQKEAVLARLTRESVALSEQARELRRMQQRIDTVRHQTSRAGSILHVLADLQKALPARLSVESLVFEQGQSMQLQGRAMSFQDALAFVSLLQKNPLFARAEMVSSNARRHQDQDIIEFQVACAWREGR